MSKIETTGQLRAVIADMIKEKQLSSNIIGLAEQINQSLATEANIAQMQSTIGEKPYALGKLPIR